MALRRGCTSSSMLNDGVWLPTCVVASESITCSSRLSPRASLSCYRTCILAGAAKGIAGFIRIISSSSAQTAELLYSEVLKSCTGPSKTATCSYERLELEAFVLQQLFPLSREPAKPTIESGSTYSSLVQYM